MNDFKKILIVDGDRTSRELVQSVAAQFGWESRGVENGDEALRVQAVEPYQAVIANLEIPGMNGFELLHQFQKTWPKTPFMLLADRPDQKSVNRAWKCGVFDFFVKPLDLDNFRDALELAVGLEEPELKARQENPFVVEEIRELSLSELTQDMLQVIGVEAFVEIVNSFKSQATEELSHLYSAVDEMDEVALRHWAHKLAGASSNLGMVEVEQLAQKIELEDISSWSIMQVYLKRLEKAIQSSLDEISELVAKNVSDWKYVR